MSKNSSILNNSVKHKFKCKYGLIVYSDLNVRQFYFG